MLRRYCFRIRPAAFHILLAFFIANVLAPGTQASLSPTEDLASKIAVRLSDSGIKSVVVFDLTGPDGQLLPFGSWAADQISNRLAGVDARIQVIERARIAAGMQNEHLAPKDAVAADAKTRISRLLGADSFVVGSFGPFKDQIGVTLVAYSTSNAKPGTKAQYMFMLNGKMRLDPEAASHLNVPLESLRPSDGVYNAGYAGNTVAECESCPLPQFPVATVLKVKQATIVAIIVVSPEGRVTEVKIVGSPDIELNAEAIKAIKDYRYKPAVDPDGEAVSVRMPFSIIFNTK